MLTTLLPEHLDLLGSVIRSGAAGGSWDPSLQEQGPALSSLLAKVHYALLNGYLPQVDPRTGRPIQTHIAGYIYRPSADAPAIGIGLFKDFSESGFELWLLGIDETWRGSGHGRAMIEELLATPLGKRAELARCAWASESARRCSRILRSNAFGTHFSSGNDEWLLHRRTPAATIEMLRASVPSLVPAQDRTAAH